MYYLVAFVNCSGGSIVFEDFKAMRKMSSHLL